MTNPQPSHPFQTLVDLACEQMGSQVIEANDDFFAPKENLIKTSSPIFIPEKYTSRGKWMDGWETRRRRTQGHDHCIVKFGAPGVIRGVNVNTAHFVGNFPESFSLEGAYVDIKSNEKNFQADKISWEMISDLTSLKGNSDNFFKIESNHSYTHLRFNIFPDGGVARLRVYGEVAPNWARIGNKKALDLASIVNGGKVIACNDMFFGNMDNLILPSRAGSMAEGWETRRRRGQGYDWIVVRLGARGKIQKVEIDTNHFKGNYPESFSLEACTFERNFSAQDFSKMKLSWDEIITQTRLKPHFRHFYEKEIKKMEGYDYVRLNIFPDGGVSRLRIYGVPV